MTEKNFSEILENAKIADAKFADDKKKQEEEAQKQIDERKALNYEKRSFKLEKEGFEERESGKWLFVTESGTIQFDKIYLENSDLTEWDSAFENAKFKKSEYLKEAEELAEKRKADAVAEAERKNDEEKQKAFNEKLSSRQTALQNLGFKRNNESQLINEGIAFEFKVLGEMGESEFLSIIADATKRKAEIEKEKADAIEAERVQKLPEIQKAERYVEEVMKIEIPQLNGVEIAEIISEFKNQIKKASDEAISKLKKLA